VHGYRPHAHDGIVSGAEDTQGESAAWAWSAGAIVSDADDLARFFVALMAGRVVPKRPLGEMIPTEGYGLGLAAFPTSCGTAEVPGVTGYVSVVWTTANDDRVVVLMGNSYPLTP